MSQLIIRQALEKHLSLLTPVVSTQYENQDYSPVTGTPYQQAYLMPAEPDNSTMGGKHYREKGFFQVTLCYPKNKTAKDAQTRAELIKAHFKRGTTITKSGLKVIIQLTPKIATGFSREDRYCVPVSIYYECDVFI